MRFHKPSSLLDTEPFIFVAYACAHRNPSGIAFLQMSVWWCPQMDWRKDECLSGDGSSHSQYRLQYTELWREHISAVTIWRGQNALQYKYKNSAGFALFHTGNSHCMHAHAHAHSMNTHPHMHPSMYRALDSKLSPHIHYSQPAILKIFRRKMSTQCIKQQTISNSAIRLPVNTVWILLTTIHANATWRETKIWHHITLIVPWSKQVIKWHKAHSRKWTR